MAEWVQYGNFIVLVYFYRPHNEHIDRRCHLRRKGQSIFSCLNKITCKAPVRVIYARVWVVSELGAQGRIYASVNWTIFRALWLIVLLVYGPWINYLPCGQWSPANSPHKGQWRGTLMFSLIGVRINGWKIPLWRHCNAETFRT